MSNEYVLAKILFWLRFGVVVLIPTAVAGCMLLAGTVDALSKLGG